MSIAGVFGAKKREIKDASRLSQCVFDLLSDQKNRRLFCLRFSLFLWFGYFFEQLIDGLVGGVVGIVVGGGVGKVGGVLKGSASKHLSGGGDNNVEFLVGKILVG